MRPPGERTLLDYFATKYRGQTLFMVFLLAVAGLFEGLGFAAVLPILQAATSGPEAPDRVSRLVIGGIESVGLNPTLPVLLTVLVSVIALKGAVLILAMQSVGFVVARVAMELRLRLLAAIGVAEWRHILEYPTGFLTNAIGTEAQRAANAYREFCGALADGAQVSVYLILVMLLSWQTATVAFVVGIGIMMLLRGLLRRAATAGLQQTELMRDILSRMTDVLPGLKPLKAMGREAYFLPMLEADTRSFFEAQRLEIVSRETLFRSREPIIVAVLALGLWGTLTVGSLEFSTVMVLALLFYRTVSAIANIQNRWVTVKTGESAFDSMMDHIAQAEASRELVADTGAEPALREAVHFRDVHFSYGESVVLDGVSASIPAGSFIVITGPSGGGKSTLLDLLTGLLRPTSGSVLVDGADLGQANVRAWRSSIGYVPQELLLVSDTLRRSLTLGDESVSDAEIQEALVMADAWSFVSEIPGGLDARIGEGGRSLSGGQRQRLSIARALLGGPRLLILDEPTTALDARSEEEVLRAIQSLRGRLTIVAVSHQPALRAVADQVWTLDGGRISTRQA